MPSRSYRLKTKEAPPKECAGSPWAGPRRPLGRLEGGEGGELAAANPRRSQRPEEAAGLLRLVRHELGSKRFRAENRRYRDAGRLLSGSRDAEVKLETLAAPAPRSPRLPERRSGALGGDARDGAGRGGGRRARGRDGQIAEASGTVEKGRGKIRHWPLQTDSWALVGEGLSTSYGDGRRATEASAGRCLHRERPRSGASGPRTSGTSCGSSARPGRGRSARRSIRPTS